MKTVLQILSLPVIISYLAFQQFSCPIYRPDTDFMNVTWHISFMGRSPAKHELGTLLSSQPIVNHYQSDYQKVQDQDSMELWSESTPA
jgi:hypothetical protein